MPLPLFFVVHVASAGPFCGTELHSAARSKKFLSLVFAGENLRSPISAFGHTFVVFHNEEVPEPDSVALEFLGITENISFSGLKALAGSLPGKYRWTCLVEKELLYDQENRDLWFYKINMTESERLNLIEEVSLGELKYGFIRNNCADRIHDLILKAARRTEPFEFIHEPIKGVRNLQEQGLVSRAGFRQPSSLKKLRHAYNELNVAEQESFDSTLKTEDMQSLSRPVAVAVSRYVNFRHRREPEAQRREFLFNLKTRFADQPLESDTSGAAAAVHESSSLRSISISSSIDRLELRFSPGGQNRWSFHEGAFVHSDLEFFTFGIGIRRENVFLREFTLLRMDSLVGRDRFEPDLVRFLDLSYEVVGGAGVEKREIGAHFGGGVGYALSNSAVIGAMPILGIRNSTNSLSSGYTTTGEFGFRFKFSLVSSNYGTYSIAYVTLFESPEISRTKGVFEFIPFRSDFLSFGIRYAYSEFVGDGAIVLNFRF